ncbi:hypothetical protein PTKIN_Ptkin06aG0051900 [Pterospermum kingtungense]
MARQLVLTPAPPLNLSQAGLAVVTLLLCAFAVVIKCASHSRRFRRQWKACYDEFFDEDPVIEINHQVYMTSAEVNGIGINQPEEAVDTSIMFSREQPVWKKNILMGEKCQLPDFSGVILYDSEGNIVTPSKTPHPLLTWK